ncbi:VacJ family lipoprotein [Comamonadaceae bacterium G21597-S1]|nr:VacJ family lipoprotein [Comamonadaceae bacterium G21597-S1]
MKQSSQSFSLRGARRIGLIALVLAACHGCASVPNPDSRDPLESFNRGVFVFNEGLDQAIFKPAATVYRDVTPRLVRTGVGNFLGNLDDAWSFVNSALQGKLRHALDNFFRFGVNSTFGIFGIFDVASEMQIERHSEDFGQTLGAWGIESGPYLVLPFFGPSTFRDAIALPVDSNGDYISHIDDVSTYNSLRVLNVIDTRARLLGLSSSLDEVAFDKYSFTRDAFLQRRRNAVYDGDPPELDPVTDQRQ